MRLKKAERLSWRSANPISISTHNSLKTEEPWGMVNTEYKKNGDFSSIRLKRQ